QRAQVGARGRDRDEPRDGTRGGTDRGGLAVLELLDEQPADDRRGGRTQGVDDDEADGGVLRSEGTRGALRAGVESEPAEPEDRGAEQRQRHVVRLLDALRETDALAEYEREGEGRGTRVDVHRGAARVVDHVGGAEPGAELHDPAATPHPRGDRE